MAEKGSVQYCVAACTDVTTASIDKGCYSDCRTSTGIFAGPSDPIDGVEFGMRTGPSDPIDGVEFGMKPWASPTTGRPRNRIQRNTYRR